MAWIIVLVVATAIVSGTVSGYIAVKRNVAPDERIDELQVQIDEFQEQIDCLIDSVKSNHDDALRAIDFVKQTDADHWNYINSKLNLWD